MKKVILITSGLIIAAAGISPYFFGGAIENEVNEQLENIKSSFAVKPNIQFEKKEYARGWFSSNVKTVLTVDGVPIFMDHKIAHGPWGYFGIGKIETTFALNERAKPVIDKLFAGKPPLLITTKIGFTGLDSVEVFSPKIIKQEIPGAQNSNISWDGLKGSFRVKGDRVITDLEIPELTISPKRNFLLHFKGLNLKGDSANLYGDIKRSATKSWTGNARLSIDKVLLRESVYNEFSSSVNLDVNTIDKQQGSLNFDMLLRLKNLKMPSTLDTSGNATHLAEFGMALEGIPKQPLAELAHHLSKFRQNADLSQQMEMAQAGQNLFMTLLQGMPRMTAHSQLSGPNGKLAMTAEAKLTAPDPQKDLAYLIMGAQSRLVIAVTPSLSENLLNVAAAKHPLSFKKDDVIESITQNNRFILNKGEYSGQFEYKQGHFYSNGQPDDNLLYDLQRANLERLLNSILLMWQ